MTDALDLSALPAPAVVEALSFERIVTALLADLRERYPDFTAVVESDPAYKILEVCAYRELLLRQRVNDAARANMLAYAGGADLDNLAALFGVGRQEGETDDELRRRTPAALAGISVAGPRAAYRAIALRSPVVRDVHVASPQPGAVTMTVLLEPEFAAALPPEPILADSIPTLAGEVARIRGDTRALLNPSKPGWRLAAAGGDDAQVDTGVTLDEVKYRGDSGAVTLGVTMPGAAAYFGAGGDGADKVLYLLRGGLHGGLSTAGAEKRIRASEASWRFGGDTPAQLWLDAIEAGDALLAIVADAGAVAAETLEPVPGLTADDARPIGDRVTLAAAAVSEYALTASVRVDAVGPDAELVRAAAEEAARKYVARAYALGRDIGIDAIHAALHVPGVTKATVTSPATDIAVGETGAARATSVTVARD